jgi:hypothetical protein
MRELPRAQQVKLLKWFWQLQKNGMHSAAAGHLEDWVFERLLDA